MNQYAENPQEVLYQLEQPDEDERLWIESLKDKQKKREEGTKDSEETQKEDERQRKEQTGKAN